MDLGHFLVCINVTLDGLCLSLEQDRSTQFQGDTLPSQPALPVLACNYRHPQRLDYGTDFNQLQWPAAGLDEPGIRSRSDPDRPFESIAGYSTVFDVVGRTMDDWGGWLPGSPRKPVLDFAKLQIVSVSASLYDCHLGDLSRTNGMGHRMVDARGFTTVSRFVRADAENPLAYTADSGPADRGVLRDAMPSLGSRRNSTEVTGGERRTTLYNPPPRWPETNRNVLARLERLRLGGPSLDCIAL